MVPCGCEDQSWGAFGDDFMQEPQQGGCLVFLPAPIMHTTARVSRVSLIAARSRHSEMATYL